MPRASTLRRAWLIAFVLLCLALTWLSPLDAHCNASKYVQSIGSHSPNGNCPTFGEFVGRQVGASWHWLKENHVFEGLVALFTVALAAVTAALAYFTLRLWRSTSSLVRGAETSDRRKLRAYVGHEPNGAKFLSTAVETLPDNSRRENQAGPVKYYEMNFGETPAIDVEMYVKVVKGIAPPPDIRAALGKTERQEVIGYVPKYQNIGRVIETPGQTWTRLGDPFFLFGYVDYSDIFRRRWRHRFAFSHDRNRGATTGEAWVAHGEYHFERRLKFRDGGWQEFSAMDEEDDKESLRASK